MRQVYELHTDCTMRGVLPVHQGKNGEKYWYKTCIKFILFINTYVNTNIYKYYVPVPVAILSITDIKIPKHQGTNDLLLVIVDTKFVSLIRGALKTNFLLFRDFYLTSLWTEQQLYIHSNTPSLSSNSKLKQIKYCFHQGACANRLCTEQQKQHLLGILQVQRLHFDALCPFLALWIKIALVLFFFDASDPETTRDFVSLLAFVL